MKNKIVIFKALAAIIAVGGAFASATANSPLVATSAYVRYTTADTSILYCKYAGICNHPGAHTCIVTVERPSLPTVNTQARVTILPINNTCATAASASHNSSSVIATIELPDDAVMR